MQARDFCFWLQGAIELGNLVAPLTAEQTDIVKRHLSLVVLSSCSVDALPRADAFVFRMKVLHDAGIAFEGEVWDNLMSQLHDVSEHQLDKEVPYKPGHTHGDAVARC